MLAVSLVLGGCATQQGGVPGRLSRAASQAGSAAATGEIAVTVMVDGRSTTPLTDTALANMLSESQDAEVAVATLVVSTPADERLRTESLTAVHGATLALTRARSWLTGGAPDDTGRAIAADLAASADQLRDLSDRLEAMS